MSTSQGRTKNRYRYVTNLPTGETWLEVQLIGGQTFVCDTDALWLVEKHIWSAFKPKNIFYASCRKAGLFHKVLTEFPMTDHIDRNGLNNRRVNLQSTTFYGNARNRKLWSRNTTGRAGVYYDKNNHDYVAGIGGHRYKRFSIRKYGNAGAFGRASDAHAKWERDNNVLSEVGSYEAPPEPIWVAPVFQCPNCDYVCSRKRTFMKHVNIIHARK